MPRQREDLTGRKFGRLTVLGFDRRDSRGAEWLLCKCDCGKTKTIRKYSLVRGDTTSCGCQWHKSVDLTGKRFNRLTVLESAGRTWQGKDLWRCRCDCGNETVVVGYNLKSGHTKTCGCLQGEVLSKINTTHGHTGDRIYNIWRYMKDRCNNPNSDCYENYGGRGISVCIDWENNFQEFYDWSMQNGYRDDLSIDRINYNEGYSPENCRWATNLEQANNKRSNRYITYANVTHTQAEWARIFNMSQHVLRHRLDRGDMRDFEEYFSNKE